MTLQTVGRYFKNVLGYEDPPPVNDDLEAVPLKMRIRGLYKLAKQGLEHTSTSDESLKRAENALLSKNIVEVMRHEAFLEVVTEKQFEVMLEFIVQDLSDNTQRLASQVKAIQQRMTSHSRS